jgi:hypothetical protein
MRNAGGATVGVLTSLTLDEKSVASKLKNCSANDPAPWRSVVRGVEPLTESLFFHTTAACRYSASLPHQSERKKPGLRAHLAARP